MYFINLCNKNDFNSNKYFKSLTIMNNVIKFIQYSLKKKDYKNTDNERLYLS